MQDVKYCFSDDTLPDGYAVKRGDMVNYQPYQMGRMKFLWGADAEEFRPERWLDDDGVFVPESPFKFTAFQVGCELWQSISLPHLQCPGQMQHVTCLASCVVV
jgi:cytochrome P450